MASTGSVLGHGFESFACLAVRYTVRNIGVAILFTPFFCNAELFSGLKNDYAWSLGTAAFTLIGFIVPSVIWVSQNNIYQVVQSAIT